MPVPSSMVAPFLLSMTSHQQDEFIYLKYIQYTLIYYVSLFPNIISPSLTDLPQHTHKTLKTLLHPPLSNQHNPRICIAANVTLQG